MNLQGAPAAAATTLVPVQMSVTLLGVARSRPLDQGLGAAARSAASLGSADRPHLSALSSSAEEAIAAIGLEPRNAHSGRHLERFQDLPRSRIDSPQIALITFPGGVPELSVDPGDPGDEAVGLDGAKRLPARRIEGVQRLSGSKPDVPAVIGDPMHAVDTREGSILADDLGR